MIEGFDTGGIEDVQDAVGSLIRDLPGIHALASAPEFDADTLDVPVDLTGGAPDALETGFGAELDLPRDPEAPDPFLEHLAEADGDLQLPRELVLPNPFRSGS